MKKKDVQALQKKDKKELMKALSEKRASLQTFRFGIAGSKTRNIREGRAARKDIARILTVLNASK